MMAAQRTISVVTGTRAEYGLLKPVMLAIRDHPDLRLQVLVAGAHLLPPERTVDEVATTFPIAATIPMQSPTQKGRANDAAALGRGVSGFACLFRDEPPDIVLVLGDRIEAFAAAAAASVAGVRVTHLHGGDRAEGIADEAMRHAITKLAHLHLPATRQSAERIVRMGEAPDRVHVVGSPAIDGLNAIGRLDDLHYDEIGRPEIVILLHPTGESAEVECERARMVLAATEGRRRVVLDPNHDAGRSGILEALRDLPPNERIRHMPRERFIMLLRRVRVIVGNSSAGLIECAALGLPAVNIGNRQAGREKLANVIDVPSWDRARIEKALADALARGPQRTSHPYGSGRAGPKTAEVLATFDPNVISLTKHNTY